MTRAAPDDHLNRARFHSRSEWNRRRAGWPRVLVFCVLAGAFAVGLAYIFGGISAAVLGRRTFATSVLQILGIILVVVAAGLTADRVLEAVRRRADAVVRRRLQTGLVARGRDDRPETGTAIVRVGPLR